MRVNKKAGPNATIMPIRAVLVMIMVQTLLILLNICTLVCSWTIETRRSTLYPWRSEGLANENATPIGWVQEVRIPFNQTFQVNVGWGDNAKPSTTLHLPFVDNIESLASSLWPSGLAGGILCQSPQLAAAFQGENANTCILELGAGLGLAGQVLAQTIGSSKCVLTDKNEETVSLLKKSIGANNGSLESLVLEWRGAHESNEERHSMDIVLGTDVAYYFFLLRPLMNTIQNYLKPNGSLLLVVGQANRESQWDLYETIRNGGYNQETDRHEDAWNGTTNMLLYQLEMCEWQQHDTEGDSDKGTPPSVEGIVPIAVLVHSTPAGSLNLDSLTGSDHHATDADREDIAMSF